MRKPDAFAADPRLIAGALRAAHEGIDPWAVGLPRDRAVVAYCVHGHQVSQGVARELRAAGFDALYLEGGIAAWQAVGLSALYQDDYEMLEHGMGMYDALYAWLCHAHDEAHNARLFER